MKLHTLFTSLAFLLGTLIPVASAQTDPAESKKYPPEIRDARVERYATIDGHDLRLWVFPAAPAGPSDAPRPAIIFFFGGGWVSGSPAQFVPQARALAARGMVACVADYRVGSRDKVKPAECVGDAKACIRWVRTHSARLRIDPNRIVAAGGSAGGHLAAATALLPGLDPDSEGKTTSSAPNALVLFNPALILAPLPGVDLSGFLANATAERFGCAPEAISPAHHVRKGSIPTLIHHGKSDSTVPYASVEKFTELMKAAGNRCELVGYSGQAHGFFNRPPFQQESLETTDAFLVSLGYLAKSPQPPVPAAPSLGAPSKAQPSQSSP